MDTLQSHHEQCILFAAPPLVQRSWKLPAAGRISKESTPVGPPTQLNTNMLIAETLHIIRPIAHCILMNNR